MIGVHEAGIGGIVFAPSRLGPGPGADPGVHGIRPLQPGLARRRDRAQEARNIGPGNPQAAQARYHDLREILANALLSGKGLGDGGIHLGGIGVKAHMGVDGAAQGFDRLAHGGGIGAGGAGEIGDGRHLRNARRGAQEVVGRMGTKIGDLVQVQGKVRGRGRQVQFRLVPMAQHAARHVEPQLRQAGGQDQFGDLVPEEIDKAAAFGGLRGDGDGGLLDLLPARQVGGGDAQKLPPRPRRPGKVVTDGQAQAIQHQGK